MIHFEDFALVAFGGLVAYGLSFDGRRWLTGRKRQRQQQKLPRAACKPVTVEPDPPMPLVLQDPADVAYDAWRAAEDQVQLAYEEWTAHPEDRDLWWVYRAALAWEQDRARQYEAVCS